jgi:hypothetical protein
LIYLKDSFLKLILFMLVEDDKKRKTKMIFRGVYDGLTNRMGKYSSK